VSLFPRLSHEEDVLPAISVLVVSCLANVTSTGCGRSSATSRFVEIHDGAEYCCGQWDHAVVSERRESLVVWSFGRAVS
jgi:hypothetical protein